MATNNVINSIISEFNHTDEEIHMNDLYSVDELKKGWTELYMYIHCFPGNLENLRNNKETYYKSGWAKDNAFIRQINTFKDEFYCITGLDFPIYPVCIIRVNTIKVADKILHKFLKDYNVSNIPEYYDYLGGGGTEFFKTTFEYFIDCIKNTFKEDNYEFTWIHKSLLLNKPNLSSKNDIYSKAFEKTNKDYFYIRINNYFNKFNKKSKDDKKFNILLSTILIFVLIEKEIGLTTIKTENIIGYDKHVKRLNEILKSLVNDIKFKDNNEKNIYSGLKIKNIKDFNDCYYIIDGIIDEILNNNHGLSKYEILKCIFKNIKNDCKSTEMKSFLSDFFISEYFMKYINNININMNTKIFLFRLSFEFIEKIFCIKKGRACENPTNKDIFSTITIGCSSELFVDIISMFISEKYNIKIDDIIIKQIKSEKDINKMKFDVCLMNPPYDGKLHMEFLDKVSQFSNNVISIQPITVFRNNVINKYNFNIPVTSIEEIKNSNEYFDINNWDSCAIITVDENKTTDYKKFEFLHEYRELTDILDDYNIFVDDIATVKAQSNYPLRIFVNCNRDISHNYRFTPKDYKFACTVNVNQHVKFLSFENEQQRLNYYKMSFGKVFKACVKVGKIPVIYTDVEMDDNALYKHFNFSENLINLIENDFTLDDGIKY